MTAAVPMAPVGIRARVYIAHPVSGDVERNLERGRAFVLHAYRLGYAPIAPWITACEVLDESNPADRALGLAASVATVAACDQFWTCGDADAVAASDGIRQERAVADACGLIKRRFIQWADGVICEIEK